MESEDGARSGVGISLVAEVGFDSSRFVGERQWISPSLRNPLLCGGVAGGLFRDRTEGGASFFCLDDAERLAVNEENVVGRATLRTHFADHDTTGSVEIELRKVLHSPSRCTQLIVDFLPSLLFRSHLESWEADHCPIRRVWQ